MWRVKTPQVPLSIPDVVALGAIGTILAILGTALAGWPPPLVHDEFAYLLAGETLALGRLANPAPASPEFFETFHILVSPTYAAKYLPGYGVMLGLGYLTTNSYRAGHFLTVGVSVAALAWGLAPFVPRWAARVATLLFALAIAGSQIATGFWPTALSMAGIFLVVGGWLRLRRGAEVTAALAAGIGASFVALTRPFEGFLICLPLALDILRRMWLWYREGKPAMVWRVAGAAGAPLLLASALLLAHNHATTGRWTSLAYTTYERAAFGAPPFVWQQPNPGPAPTRVTEVVRAREDLARYAALRQDPARTLRDRVLHAATYYGTAITIALALFSAPALGLPGSIAVWSAIALGCAAAILSSNFNPHYVGPLLAVVWIVAARGYARVAQRWSRFAHASVAAFLIVAAARHAFATATRIDPVAWSRQRAALEEQVRRQPGQHVIFVRYLPSYSSKMEWVQNGANLEGTRVLWVHDRGDSANAALLARMQGRQGWILPMGPRTGSAPQPTPYFVDGGGPQVPANLKSRTGG